MKRSILIVMLDVMVLSVLSLNVGRGGAGFLVPVYQWSSMIEQGLAREQQFQARIEELQQQAEQAERKAREAAALADRHKELQDTALQQLETLSAREAAAHARMQEALDKERAALIEAEMAAERQRLAEEQASQALALKQDADAQARAADEAARQARIEAELAAQRESEIARRIEDMRKQEERLLAQTAETSQTLAETEQDRALSRERLEQAQQAVREAREREQAALAQAEADRRRAEELRLNASLAEERAREALERMEDSQGYIQALSERIVSLRLNEQEARLQFEAERETTAELRQRIEVIEEEQRQSVWVQRDRALVACSIQLAKRDRAGNQMIPYTHDIHVPIVMIDGHPYLVADYEQFGLGWWHVQTGGGLYTARYRLFDAQQEEELATLRSRVIVDEDMPHVAYLPIGRDVPDAQGLVPAGIGMLKRERIREALAFSPESPDASVRVEITPMRDERFLTVRAAQARGGLFSRRELRAGDYLLTDTGHFIGIMLSGDTCYVMPEAGIATARRIIDVPLTPDESGLYDTFVHQARLIRRAARQTEF